MTNSITGVVFESPTFENPKFKRLLADKSAGFPIYIEGSKLVIHTNEFGVMKLPLPTEFSTRGTSIFLGTKQGSKTLPCLANQRVNLFNKGYLGQPDGNLISSLSKDLQGIQISGQFNLEVAADEEVSIIVKNAKEELVWTYKEGLHLVNFGNEFMVGSSNIAIYASSNVDTVIKFTSTSPSIKLIGIFN